jgi:hypothetical protein
MGQLAHRYSEAFHVDLADSVRQLANRLRPHTKIEYLLNTQDELVRVGSRVAPLHDLLDTLNTLALHRRPPPPRVVTPLPGVVRLVTWMDLTGRHQLGVF